MMYAIEVLREAATQYCYAECDYRMYSKKLLRAKETLEYWDCPEGWNRDYDMYWRESNNAWDKLKSMCKLVGADMASVLAVEKSIRRNSQYRHNWEREAHFGPSWMWYGEEQGGAGSEASYRRTVKEA